MNELFSAGSQFVEKKKQINECFYCVVKMRVFIEPLCFS